MEKLTIDNELRAKLHNFQKEVALCDDRGRPLAHVLPADQYQRLVYAWAKTQFTDEEIERARQEPGGLTTAEALAFIEGLVRSARQGQ